MGSEKWRLSPTPASTRSDYYPTFPADDKYTGELRKVWCRDRFDAEDICDGTAGDCMEKGKSLCDARSDCFGVLYHPGQWSNNHKGVKLCSSTVLEFKTDWVTVMKQDPSNRKGSAPAPTQAPTPTPPTPEDESEGE